MNDLLGDKTPTNETDDLSDDESDDFLAGPDEAPVAAADDGAEGAGSDAEGAPKPADSAVYQKQKYREKYEQTQSELEAAKARLAELESKSALSPEEAKEKQSKEFLANLIRETMAAEKSAQESRAREATRKFRDELDAALEGNPGIPEKRIVDLCEDLGVSPAQALKVVQREEKLKGPAKPSVPTPRRSSPEVKGPDAAAGPKTLDAANRHIKDMIRRGEL